MKLPKIRMTGKERLILGGGIILLLLLLFLQFSLRPVRKKMRVLDRKGTKLEQALKEIYSLRNCYLILEERLKFFEERIAAQPPSFTLFSYLESLASQVGIKERIDYLKPEEMEVSERYNRSLVKGRLRGVTLSQLTSYLYSIESSPYFLQLRKLHIIPQKKEEGLLDITFEVFTLVKKKL